MQDTSTELGTAAENHDLSTDDDTAADAAAGMTVDVTPANQATIDGHSDEPAPATADVPAEDTDVRAEDAGDEEAAGEAEAALEEAATEEPAIAAGVAEEATVEGIVDEEADGDEPVEEERREEPAYEEWETDEADEAEPIAEVLVDTAITVGAAAASMFGSIAGAAMRYAGTTQPGRVVGDITAGVRKAVTREGEPYLESAGRWSQEQLARLVAAVTPAVVDAIDFTELAERLDLDALLARIDTDALMERVDVERMAERVNVRALLEQLDLSSVRLRVDLAPEGGEGTAS